MVLGKGRLAAINKVLEEQNGENTRLWIDGAPKYLRKQLLRLHIAIKGNVKGKLFKMLGKKE